MRQDRSASARGPVLLTVSGRIPADLDDRIRSGRRPRADYLELARVLDADLLDHEAAASRGGRTARLLGRVVGPNLALAWVAFRLRGRYRVLLTDGEQIGLPVAALVRVFGRRGGRHAMIVHVLSVRKKAMVVRALRLQRTIDRWIVYASAQRDALVSLGVPPDRIALVPFMVDTAWWAPASASAERVVSSAGLERRDYPTLMRAVEGLDADVVIAAASPWSRQADSTEGATIPANVTVQRLDFEALRDLYTRSAVVVMPLEDVDFQAGITTILEAMSMGKAIVCTRTRGQTDMLVDGVTGVYVPPYDADALREAVGRLLDDRHLAARLGAAARAEVLRRADIEVYAARIAAEVDGLSGG